MRIGFGLALMVMGLPALAAAKTDWRVAPTAPIDLAVALPEGMSFAPRNETLFTGTGFQDRLSVTARAVPSDEALTAPWRLKLEDQDQNLDLSYRRDWQGASGETASGLEVSLTPHAGFGVSDGDPTAEAGATLRIGQGLDRLARDGTSAFGERPRWYVYAAGSKRAVGYNFARNRDGDFARSGVSHDGGSYLGDASIGVAYRRGAINSSFGIVYREIEAKGLHAAEGLRSDVSEGLVAFQLSIKP